LAQYLSLTSIAKRHWTTVIVSYASIILLFKKLKLIPEFFSTNVTKNCHIVLLHFLIGSSELLVISPRASKKKKKLDSTR